MYYILPVQGVKSGGKFTKQFYVLLVADNGEPLSTSEVLSSKQKAWGNIKAQLETNGPCSARIQDDVPVKSVAYVMFSDGRKVKAENPSKKYIPGKNPKKKK